MSEIEDFIVEELSRQGVDYDLNKNFIHVSCPYHEHSGQKKKLGFNRTTGSMHCLVCGHGGHFNAYAKLMNLKTINVDDPQLQDFSSIFKDWVRMKEKADQQPSQPDVIKPWVNPAWRGLPRAFVESVPSYVWFDPSSKADRILWPVYVNDEFRGCSAARIDPEDATVFPKTRNLSGLDSKRALFPFNHPLVKKSKTIVMVEGQFDALRLLYHGIPAVSIFGTGDWDKCKLRLLGGRKDVKRLILAFDGDLAGERCTDAVLHDGAERWFDTRVMVFPDPTDEERNRGIKAIDPGNCAVKYLKIIKSML